jgi:hypothetical protein
MNAVFGPVEKKFVHPNIYLNRESARARGVVASREVRAPLKRERERERVEKFVHP